MVGRRTVLLGGLAAGSLAGLGGLAGCTRTEAGMRVAYGTGPSQFGELSVPAGSGPWPVVVVIHGGFWRSSYDLDLGRPLAVDLVAHGVAAWNLEYRRVGAGGGWPATCDDVAAAVDALAGPVQEAAGGRLDLGRVVAVGHSAGGHLVGWLATRRSDGHGPGVAVRGVVAQAGVLDLVQAARLNLGGGAVQAFLGGPPTELPEVYAAASPIARLPAGVPVVCVHGERDDTVPISQSERFVAAAGGTAVLRRFDGDHFAPIDVTSDAWRTCRTEALRLLG